MGDPGNTLESSSASMNDSCPWTEVCASDIELASLNTEHLDFLSVYDRSMVSVGRKIGEGGQGCVYEAKFHLPYSFKPVPVVVKKFKPFEGVSQGNFPREMFALKNTNLCLPIGVFFEGDSLCMIMRRYSCDLRAAIDSRMRALPDEVFGTNGPPFTEEVGRFIILQLARGLKALHECGVYHGDLKAANVLLRTIGKNYGTSLSEPASLAIADFERSEGVVGTAFFRAPEVLRSLDTDIPLSKEQWLLADVYSFGMVCYEVLTGMIPFEGHPLCDYDLVLNGGRPELPDHVPQYWRDLLLRCWHADPHSRPSWADILEVLAHDDALVTGDVRSYVYDFLSVDSLSFESLIHEAKQVIRDLTALHESDSKSFGSEFMPYYWVSEFLATAEKIASKIEADLDLEEGPLMCDVQESFERLKLFLLLTHQLQGANFGYVLFIDLILEQRLDTLAYVQVQETVRQRNRLPAMLSTFILKGFQEFSRMQMQFTEEFEVGTSWAGRLVFFHALVKWVLWYEHAEDGWGREFMMNRLLPTHWSLDTGIDALLIFFCMILNTYIYVLAMITYEPILLGLQYGLYKIKGCNNFLYRSSGERICRFQRVGMNCTRYKVVSIVLSFSFASLLTIFGWRGILGWILFPCVIICTPYWRQPIIVR